MTEKKSPSLSTKDIAIRGSIMASIITIPSVSTFFVTWTILDDVFTAAIIGGVVHFIAMGFSLKISKKFLARSKPESLGDD